MKSHTVLKGQRRDPLGNLVMAPPLQPTEKRISKDVMLLLEEGMKEKVHPPEPFLNHNKSEIGTALKLIQDILKPPQGPVAVLGVEPKKKKRKSSPAKFCWYAGNIIRKAFNDGKTYTWTIVKYDRVSGYYRARFLEDTAKQRVTKHSWKALAKNNKGLVPLKPKTASLVVDIPTPKGELHKWATYWDLVKHLAVTIHNQWTRSGEYDATKEAGNLSKVDMAYRQEKASPYQTQVVPGETLNGYTQLQRVENSKTKMEEEEQSTALCYTRPDHQTRPKQQVSYLLDDHGKRNTIMEEDYIPSTPIYNKMAADHKIEDELHDLNLIKRLNVVDVMKLKEEGWVDYDNKAALNLIMKKFPEMLNNNNNNNNNNTKSKWVLVAFTKRYTVEQIEKKVKDNKA
eukprot:jgi/Psemu1/43605/gm1.43605_g